VVFNFRFSTQLTPEQLRMRVESVLQRFGISYEIQWALSGQPFLTQRGALVDAVSAATHEISGLTPELSTSVVTSDGRFIAPIGSHVVELVPLYATIHKIDECVQVDELEPLSAIYERMLEKILG